MLPVVILAGGMATRLKPITESVPKALLEVAGKPFIEHQLDLLKKNGVKDVVLCVGHFGEMIEAHIGDGRKFDISVQYSYDGDKLLGTGGAIKKAETLLDESFFVLYGDSYLDVDYGGIEAAYLSVKYKGLMTVYENENKWDKSNVVYKNNEIVIYSKKAKREDMRHIDFGLGIVCKQVFQHYKNDTVFDLADVYERLAKEGLLQGYEVFDRFYEIGSIEGLEGLEKKLSENRK